MLKNDKAKPEMYRIFGFEIEVNDELLVKALNKLPERKRNVILLAFFVGMKDAEIARMMNLARSTVHYHRKSALWVLNKMMNHDQN